MLVNTTQTGDQFHGQIAGVNAPILNGRRATLLPTVAFRLWAAASICLATDGATAAESVTVAPLRRAMRGNERNVDQLSFN
jgi:hypothetical protein